MGFWLTAILLTLGASLAVLAPLTRAPREASADEAHDLEVYRDQLAEIDRDEARGLIPASEREQARAEVARRLLKAHAEANRAQSAGPIRSGTRLAGAAAVLAVPLVSWGIYSSLGSPDLPSQPLAARLDKPASQNSIEELVARAEGHLARNPDDSRGWDVVAPIYVRLGRYAEAAAAYRSAIRSGGETAARLSGLGEALADQGEGIILGEALAAFQRAKAIEPNDPKASFYLAMAAAQGGRYADAIVGWRAMLTTVAQDSPWRGAAEQAIAEAERQQASGAPARPGPARPGPATPGPDGPAVAAAAEMSDADRAAMIEGMVAGLDQKLRANPRDLDGWTRLVRSYVVLGRTDAARDAVKRATEAFGAGSDEARQLADVSGSLGLNATD